MAALRHYIVLLLSSLLGQRDQRMQPVMDTNLPLTCTSAEANKHIDLLQPDAWKRALQTGGGVGGGRFVDISMPLHADTVTYSSNGGLGAGFRKLQASQQQGDAYTASVLALPVHTGTHVDAPGHFVWPAYASGLGADLLDLHALIGPALVVDVRGSGTNLTAALLQSLRLPAGIERLIFKTDNTNKGLLRQRAFDPSYTAMTTDGARWLAEHVPSLRSVGIDALSIATWDDIVGAHVALLGNGLIAVEGLLLHDVEAGLWDMFCLPLNVAGSDGAPARCVLSR